MRYLQNVWLPPDVTRWALAGIGILAAILMPVEKSHAQTPGIAPHIEDRKITSLHRAHDGWKVKTVICLSAEDQDSTIVNLAQVGAGPVHGKVEPVHVGCGLDPAGETERRNSALFNYTPDVGYTGTDRFHYQATDAEGHLSQIASVEVDVVGQGVRWELLTASSTGLTSDGDSLGHLASVLGKTTEDFMFVLNWQPLSPRQKRIPTSAVSTSNVRMRRTVVGERLEASRVSRSLNVQLMTGLQSGPVATTATDAGAPPPEGAAEEAIDTQRYVTWGTKVNYNSTINADGLGTYLELGVVGSANADVFVEDVEALRKSGARAIELLRDSRGVFRGELGVHVALKQYQETGSTIIIDGDKVIHPSNLDDLAVAEFLYQRNGAFGGASALDGGSIHRWVLRLTTLPRIPAIPGSPRLKLGVEINREVGGGPASVKVVYGVVLSGKGLF